MNEKLTDLEIKIYEQLDIIRIMSRLSICASIYEAKNLPCDYQRIIFEDIIEHCWNISEYVEEMVKLNTHEPITFLEQEV